MSNQMPHQTFEPHPPVPPMPVYVPNPKRPKKRFLVPILVITALLFGVATGAASTSAKEVEVIKEVPVEKIVEKEVTVEVPVTPEACTDALDYASIIFTMNADAIGTMQDMLQHAVAMDAAGLEADTAKLDKQTQELGKVKTPFTDAVKECRAS